MKNYSMVDEALTLINSKQGIASLFILIVLLFLHLRSKKDALSISQWQKSLNLQEHLQIFQQLYQKIDGFLLSQRARQRQDRIEYTYGEIEFLPFIALLSLAKPDGETVFYDLGSGVGKAVLACAFVYPVHQSIGVELLPELYLEACNQTKQLAVIQHYDDKAKKITFILGNFLDVDLNDATLIFINATTFVGSLWENINTRLNNLPKLKTVITTSKPLITSNFLLIKSTKIQMSWGVVHAYIHTKKEIYTNLVENIE
jgi:SAM-dependent methyltransferase